jgi:hypothetical protein
MIETENGKMVIIKLLPLSENKFAIEVAIRGPRS